MINYSEYGTVVDKIRYSCDYLIKPKYSTTKLNDSKTVSNVKNLIKFSKKKIRERAENRIEGNLKNNKIDKNENKDERKEDNLEVNKFLFKNDNMFKCNCDKKLIDEQDNCGWEGSSILNHGNYLI